MTGALGAGGVVPLAVLHRSGFPESMHLGAAAVVAPGGTLAMRRGDVDALVYPRSAWKPFQTIAALRAGVGLDAPGLAIVTASHRGTPRHVSAVRAVLASAGASEDDLRTPEAWPSSRSAAHALVRRGCGPSRIAMNCSGNHAGMIAASSELGWPIARYLDQASPVHALAAACIREHTGRTPSHPGVDGCGGPVWAIPLSALARGYASIVRSEPALLDAVAQEPELLEGTGTDTTRAVSAFGILAKSGAEGVWCAATPAGAAVAVKVLDGGHRAAAAIAIALLGQVGALQEEGVARFLDDPAFAVRGGGREVGRLSIIRA